jgi:hypothetical protein
MRDRSRFDQVDRPDNRDDSRHCEAGGVEERSEFRSGPFSRAVSHQHGEVGDGHSRLGRCVSGLGKDPLHQQEPGALTHRAAAFQS